MATACCPWCNGDYVDGRPACDCAEREERGARHGATHAYLDAPRTTSKVGEHGPYTPAPVVATDDVRALREMACAAYEQTLTEICDLCFPVAEQNALVIAAIRRKEAMMAAIGGAS